MAARIAIVGRRYHGLLMEAASESLTEWIEPDKRAAIRLARRIRQRTIHGVVLILSDLTHGVSVPILTACRLMGVRLTACEKRSQTQIRSALDALVSVGKELPL